MAHLYELSNDFNHILNLIEDMTDGNTDLPEEVLWDTIEGIESELRDKAVQVACLIKSLNSDIAAFKEEEKKLSTRRKSLENKVEWMKNYLTFELDKSGVSQIKDRPEAQISFRNNKSIEVKEDFINWAIENKREDLLNITYAASKTAIKQNLDAGAEIPYAEVVENKSIIIK